MELLADEHVRRSLTRSLERQGIPVHHVRDEGRTGAADKNLFDFARDHEYILLTNDDDFAPLAAAHNHAGVIFISTQYATDKEIAREIVRLTDQLTTAEFRNGTFYVP